MSSLFAFQIEASDERSGTTAAGSITDEKQQQGEAGGDVLRTGSSGEPDFRREPTRKGLLDRLGRSSNAYRAEERFALEKAMFPSALVPRRTKFILMMTP